MPLRSATFRPVESAAVADPAAAAAQAAALALAEARKPRPFSLLTGDDLPTGRKAVVRGMKGKAQQSLFDALQTANVMQRSELINEAMLLCTESLDGKTPSAPDILALHSADRRALLLRMRRRAYVSTGVIKFEWICGKPHVPNGCGHVTRTLVNLDDIETVPVPALEPITLPVSGKVFTFAEPTGKSEVAYQQYRLASGGATDKIDLNDLVRSRQGRLDADLASAATLDDLFAEDRDRILDALTQQGGPDTRFPVSCSACQATWKTRVEGLADFFFPVGGA